MKVNVGISKKIGQPNYGSRGASVGIEVEIDDSTLADRGKLEKAISQLAEIAEASVNRQLGEQQASDKPSGTASERQVKCLYARAKNRRLDLGQRVQQEYGVSKPEELSRKQASELIDKLQGEGRRELTSEEVIPF